jgi:hypothetical protein
MKINQPTLIAGGAIIALLFGVGAANVALAPMHSVLDRTPVAMAAEAFLAVPDTPVVDPGAPPLPVEPASYQPAQVAARSAIPDGQVSTRDDEVAPRDMASTSDGDRAASVTPDAPQVPVPPALPDLNAGPESGDASF